jgi:hypothetical protein
MEWLLQFALSRQSQQPEVCEALDAIVQRAQVISGIHDCFAERICGQQSG